MPDTPSPPGEQEAVTEALLTPTSQSTSLISEATTTSAKKEPVEKGTLSSHAIQSLEMLNSDYEIYHCVEKLEASTHLFRFHLLDSMSLGIFILSIIEFMDDILFGFRNDRVFVTHFWTIKLQKIAITAIHAFYGSSELREQSKDSPYRIYTAMIIIYISRKMQQHFNQQHKYVLSKRYLVQEKFYKKCIIDTLDNPYFSKHGDPSHSIKFNYRYLVEGIYNSSFTLLDLAKRAEFVNFAYHPFCHHVIDDRWMPGCKTAVRNQLNNPITHYVSLAWDITRVERKNAYDKRKCFQKRGSFYSSPRSKFALHTVCYLAYLVLFSTVILRSTRNSVYFSDASEILLFLWQVSFFCDMMMYIEPTELKEAGHSSFRRYLTGIPTWINNNPWDTAHNLLNFMSFVSLPTLALNGLNGFSAVPGRFCFYASYILSMIRILRIFAAETFVGSVVLLMRRMLKTLLSFFIVFCMFWLTFSITTTSLKGDFEIMDLPWRIISTGPFELFGDINDGDKKGTVTNCTEKFDWNDVRAKSVDCLFRTWMIPILLFIYVFASSVLLVNVLIAFFTNTLTQVQESDHLHYRFMFYERVIEFENKIFLPPPLSIIVWIYGVIRAVVKKLLPSSLTSNTQDSIEMQNLEKSDETVAGYLDPEFGLPPYERLPHETAAPFFEVEMYSFNEKVAFNYVLKRNDPPRDTTEQTTEAAVRSDDKSRVAQYQGTNTPHIVKKRRYTS